jgi:tRNA(Arg) A34 adenosine deaminase TadA
MSQNDEHWMRLAIAVAQENPSAPFAAVIVDNDSNQECARGVNQAQMDPTLHAEMVALHTCYEAGTPSRSGDLTFYTTAEPCPMCAAACFWAGIERIVYGVSIPWLHEHGWRQMGVRAVDVLAGSDRSIGIVGGVLADECKRLFMAAR